MPVGHRSVRLTHVETGQIVTRAQTDLRRPEKIMKNEESTDYTGTVWLTLGSTDAGHLTAARDLLKKAGPDRLSGLEVGEVQRPTLFRSESKGNYELVLKGKFQPKPTTLHYDDTKLDGRRMRREVMEFLATAAQQVFSVSVCNPCLTVEYSAFPSVGLRKKADSHQLRFEIFPDIIAGRKPELKELLNVLLYLKGKQLPTNKFMYGGLNDGKHIIFTEKHYENKAKAKEGIDNALDELFVNLGIPKYNIGRER